MNVLDLFSGIGGFSLGLERAGFKTVAFCEIEPYCRAVLKRHWPEVPCYEDIRTLSADTLRRDGIIVDAICGGFPCQDLSYAGKRAGIEGSRSGLWSEYARLISEIRPRFAIMENVPGLLSAGMGRVLGDLAALGYDAWWDCIPASAIGAHHRRDRIWIVAHTNRPRLERRDSARMPERAGERTPGPRRAFVSDRDRAEREGSIEHSDARGIAGPSDSNRREPKRGLGRVVHGVSDWMDEHAGIPRVASGQKNRQARIRCLGNAIVPAVAELIGRAIMRAEGMK